MPVSDLWTSSQREAWGYIQLGYDQGMRQTEALKAYRAGGGAIRTASWSELWHRYDEGSNTWNTLYQYGMNDVIPESMYEPVGVDYRSKYNIVFKSNIRMDDGSILHDQYRTIRSNYRMSLSEIYGEIEDTLSVYAGEYGVSYTSVSDIKFYSRG